MSVGILDSPLKRAVGRQHTNPTLMSYLSHPCQTSAYWHNCPIRHTSKFCPVLAFASQAFLLHFDSQICSIPRRLFLLLQELECSDDPAILNWYWNFQALTIPCIGKLKHTAFRCQDRTRLGLSKIQNSRVFPWFPSGYAPFLVLMEFPLLEILILLRLC